MRRILKASVLFLDLDNTLVDRDSAFRDATVAFLEEHALPESDLEWVMELDASGYTPRSAAAEAMTDRYGELASWSAIRDFLSLGGADRVVLSKSVRDALGRAIAAGWWCVIVTNGQTLQQEAKIRKAGLDELVQGWVISEQVGHKKPSAEIFRAAAATVGASVHGAWIVGDSPRADIAGAQALGVRSVWVSGGRPWGELPYQPTHVAVDTASAINHVIDHSRWT